MSDIRIECEFWNHEQQECRVAALFNEQAGETLWPGASCRWEIEREALAGHLTRELVVVCRLRALAQGRAFTVAETCHVPAGDWAEKIVGQWPGDETDKEIEAELAAMHGVGECPTCHGSGEVVVCVDDMCRAAGRCLHGDGERPCPDCQE